ncbi:MAG: PKD domain-containing protein [Cryomorphaceae bacterium]|nr:PKD domain-containing protein [Cryomorphaceae bacterium]
MEESVMKMKTSILILLFTIMVGSVFGQSEVAPCASGHRHEQLVESDTLYQRSWFNFEQRMLQLANQQAESGDRDETIYVFPVVFHIIHEGEPIGQSSNISDAQIFSAIDALNEDFRKIAGSNGDGNGVDVGFEFCLASRDPSGNSTTGIVRVDGSSIPNYAEQGIRATGSVGADEATVKALSTWPREQYINIWVVNEIEDNNASSGIQGFAYFPINNPIDGIVMLHNAVGTTGNIKPSTALNRTLSHEVGHFFGLYHTFHLTNDCTSESNCTTQGDRVCDTPPTILASSCGNPACSGTQQVENYMDYTPESCRDMFSQGQKDRMRNTLLTQRLSLTTSFGCVPVTSNDAGITSVNAPAASGCNSTFQPNVTLTNFGSSTLTSVTFNYNVDNIGTQTYAWTGSLASGSSTDVALPQVATNFGSHTFNAWITNPNGVADQNNGNDENTKNFTVATGVGVTMTVTLDYFGAETSWDIKLDGDVVASGGPYNNSNQGAVFSSNVCMPSDCYTLHVYDTYGDGMSLINGTYSLTDDDGVVLANGGGNFGLEAVHNFCVEYVNTETTPTANFAASATSTCAGNTVNFSDLSLGSPTAWTWSFPGGSPSSSSVANPQNITYASAGTYAVTLTASNGAGSDVETKTSYLTIHPKPTLSTSISSVSCNGGSNGSATVTASGGNGFSYSWSNGQSGATLSNVGAGSYTVTVTNSNSCSQQATANVTQPTNVNLSVTPVNITCNGAANGSASAITSGGTGSINLSWSNGQNGNNIVSLTPGNYQATATDANGCAKTSSFSISQPTVLVPNLTANNISCNGQPGSASISSMGGTPPYTNSWSTGQTGSTISNLDAGSYSVTTTDGNGCSSIQNFTITETNQLNVNINAGQISCFGMNDGSATATVSGGNIPYTYSWSTGNTGTSISGRGPGTYTLNVIDSDGCSGSAQVTLIEPSQMNLAIFKSDISCFGNDDGTASATATGGTAPYAFSWSNGEQAENISGLGVGEYTLVITDSHGCNAEESIQIIEPSEISASALVSQSESCAGMDGEAIVNAMGGTGNYTYSWSNGSNNQMLSNASSGAYVVTVTDDNGCSTNATISIPYNCDQAPEPTMLDAASCGASGLQMTQTISCIPVDGASMYQWRFSNIASGAFSDEYTLGSNPNFMLSTVPNLTYDMTMSVMLRVLNESEIWSDWGEACLISMSDNIPQTSISNSDCSAGVMLAGNMIQCNNVPGADRYEWQFTAGNDQIVYTSFMNLFNLTNADDLIIGETYGIRVRAAVGEVWGAWGSTCTLTYENAQSVTTDVHGGFEVSIYPNPNDGENISFNFRNLPSSAHVIDLEVYDGSGKLIENTTLSTLARKESLTYQFRNRLSAGIYFLKIRLQGDVVEEKLIIK